FDAGPILDLALCRSHQTPWAMPLVHQAFEQTQPFHLIEGIKAFSVRVALRLREAVAPLPYPQNILRQSHIAFNGGDIQTSFRHFVQDKQLTKVGGMVILRSNSVLSRTKWKLRPGKSLETGF